MNSIESGTFAESCYEMNSINDLKDALQHGADSADMKEWGIDEQEWRENIELAISVLEGDE